MSKHKNKNRTPKKTFLDAMREIEPSLTEDNLFSEIYDNALEIEPRDEWGQGDSIADLYAKSGAVVSQVSSAKDLLNFLQSAGTTRHL